MSHVLLDCVLLQALLGCALTASGGLHSARRKKAEAQSVDDSAPPDPVSLSNFWGIYTEPRLMALRHLSPRCPPRHGYYPDQLLGHWKAGIPASCPWSLQAWGASAISVPFFGEMGITELLPCHARV